ncbi:MAG: hypothetical protein ACJA13_004141 [Paraglaciecola sp.]|jgi:hypothetical protein
MILRISQTTVFKNSYFAVFLSLVNTKFAQALNSLKITIFGFVSRQRVFPAVQIPALHGLFCDHKALGNHRLY